MEPVPYMFIKNLQLKGECLKNHILLGIWHIFLKKNSDNLIRKGALFFSTDVKTRAQKAYISFPKLSSY